MTNLTSKQLRRAADIQDKIESLQRELDGLLGNRDGNTSAGAKKAGKRTMSAAAKAKISAAAKARWAKIKSKQGK